MTAFWLNFAPGAESARIQYLENHLPHEVGFGRKRCQIYVFLLVFHTLYGSKVNGSG